MEVLQMEVVQYVPEVGMGIKARTLKQCMYIFIKTKKEIQVAKQSNTYCIDYVFCFLKQLINVCKQNNIYVNK
jgi:hypothetical protein